MRSSLLNGGAEKDAGALRPLCSTRKAAMTVTAAAGSCGLLFFICFAWSSLPSTPTQLDGTLVGMDNTALGKAGHLVGNVQTHAQRLSALNPSGQPARLRSMPVHSQSSRFSSGELPSSYSDTYTPTDKDLRSHSRRDALLAATAGTASLFPLPTIAKEGDMQTPDIYKPPASVAGKTVLITGANSGLGLESAKRLAQAGARVVLTARTQGKADEALAAVKAVAPNANAAALQLDLASLESIRSFPTQYKAALGNAPLDVLMANAGVMAIPERVTTSDGFEKQVGINHLGHFALVSALMPELRKAADGFRIVLVSSDAHWFATEDSMKNALASNLDPKDYSQWGAYGISKAANILFAKELQRRFDSAGIRASAVSLHPGSVDTSLGRYLIQGVEKTEAGVSVEDTKGAMSPLQRATNPWVFFGKLAKRIPQGANTQVFLAAAGDSNGDLTKDGGNYFTDMKLYQPAPYVNDQDLATKLWEVSETLTGAKISI
eukprot:gnl/TRDRNA2_/TRDRNA2_28894_c0_seq1.p1 gnl/TRDRNA2_/TRDRNA2_28894_c0~~gnl/TRDRNA2_/TRDRNA2_28894_c0_seq1.p1  ORF type:complete len:492 (+),score=83.08 gnl/TRDRNA2_/TRDRNA2_28894_c0_seq1:33-1508(+)